ncbi:MAG: hypothetical protein ACYTGZ_03045 [Planctomycetota bacterium]
MLRAAPILLAILVSADSLAQDPTPSDPAGVTAKERDAAIVKMMRYLDEAMWKLQDGGSPRRQYTLAVAGWAYAMAADKPKAGGRKLPSRKKQLDRIRKELARYTERVADLYDKDDKRKKKKKQRDPSDPRARFAAMRTAQYSWTLAMNAHLFAELAARGKGSAQAKKTLKSIIRVLDASQQPNGGWGHDDASREGMGLPPIKIPKPGGGQLEYPGTLLAASHCALSGMGVACRATKKKKLPALKKGREYFGSSQNGDGTFPYDPAQKHKQKIPAAMAGGIELARTSGGVFALFCAGAPDDDAVALSALAAIDASPKLMSEGHGSATMALQFGALLARARGDLAWRTFRRIYLRRIIDHMDERGSCKCVCEHKSAGVTCDTREIPGMPMAGQWVEGNKTYVTAIHLLILMLDRTETRAIPKMPGPRGPVTPKR